MFFKNLCILVHWLKVSLALDRFTSPSELMNPCNTLRVNYLVGLALMAERSEVLPLTDHCLSPPPGSIPSLGIWASCQ